MSDDNPGQNGKEETPYKEKTESEEEAPPVRVVLLGITGPPKQWQAVYGAADNVCQSMCFPFSPDQPESDRRLYGNVVEYAATATDLQGDLIAGQPTIVFCLPGIDRTRRMGIVTEAIPRTLRHHRVYGKIVYFGKDLDDEEIGTGLVEAMARGFDTHEAGHALEDFSAESFAQHLSQWMTRLDPQDAASDQELATSPVQVF